MTKIHLAATGLLVALLTALLGAVAPSASAATYPDPVCTLTVSATSLKGGDELLVTVRSDVATDLSATFRGETQSASNTTLLEATFKTPKVGKPTKAQVTATCGGVTRSTTVTLLPAGADIGDGTGNGDGDQGSGIGGILPSTGGPAFWLLLLGILLVLAGLTVAVRRRQA